MTRPKAEVLFEWKSPEIIADYEIKKLFQEGKTAAPRILIFTAGLLIILYFALNRVLPEDFDMSFTKSFIGIFLFAAVLMVYIYLVFPLIMRYSRDTYKITEKGIKVAGGTKSTLLRWDKLEGYTLERSEKVSEISVLTIYGRGTRRRLYLPKGKIAEEIKKVISERVQPIGQEPDSYEKIKLSKLQYLYLCLLSLVYSICAVYFISTHPNKFVFRLIILFVAVFGPGTLGLLSLFGRKLLTNRHLKLYALVFNMLAVGLTMLFMFFCIIS